MPTIQENYSLKGLNTFGIDVATRYFISVSTIDELKASLEWVKQHHLEYLILGGGSNILFTSNFKGAIIHPEFQGIDIISDEEDSTLLRVGAGVNWDDFVGFSVNRNLCGIENLSSIPGTVGASPIQNIGAYGVEAKDTIDAVEGIYTDTLAPFKLFNSDCEFGYRDSIFKNNLKGKVVVTHVLYRLSKTHNLKTHYGNLDLKIEKLGAKTLQNVRTAVANIRSQKLPDPKEIGNAGSFFKNPVVDISLVGDLQQRFDKVPFYPVNDFAVKLPAGWLIEQCGWKGKRVGNVGVHKDQALVLVNFGNASGTEIVDLAHKIRQSVMEAFNVSLEMEVNVVKG